LRRKKGKGKGKRRGKRGKKGKKGKAGSLSHFPLLSPFSFSCGIDLAATIGIGL
jgi:hypothetical protein